MLDAIERVKPDEFMRTFFADANARNVCSVAPIYCVLRVMNGSTKGTSLRYGQAVDSDRGGAVSFGSVVFTTKSNRP